MKISEVVKAYQYSSGVNPVQGQSGTGRDASAPKPVKEVDDSSAAGSTVSRGRTVPADQMEGIAEKAVAEVGKYGGQVQLGILLSQEG